MRDENTNDRKVEKLQNVSHFSYFLDRFILHRLVLLQLLSNLFKIHGFRNPSLKFQGFVRTHAKAATPPYFKMLNAKAAVAQR